MVQDKSVDPSTSEAASHKAPAGPSLAGRTLLFGGVALACAAGVGVGLWARPSDLERPGAPKAQPAALPMAAGDRRLAIVVDDTPAPVGKPLDVLARPEPRPAVLTPPPRAQAPVPPQIAPHVAEPIAPRRPPEGLVRVVAPVPGPLIPARAPPPPIVAPKPVKAKAAAPAATPKVQTARIQSAKPKADRAERLAKASHGKRRAHETEVAVAAAPPPKPRHGFSAITRALARLAPHHTKVETAEAGAPPRNARKEPARRAEVRQARATPEKPARVRLASAPSRCASSDPGEALACGDPNLSAADRRLTRAYRDAEAAGVPAATLERQQQRWRAARAAAAREAPWAVREVYQARIAELQDQARDARGN